MRMEGGWEIKQVLYINDTVLVAKTREHLQPTVNDFERLCDSMELKIMLGRVKC